MELIEEYHHTAEGYNPYLIREGWQVAKLNHLPGHSLDEIKMVEAHCLTDEVFILLAGTGVLIVADVDGDKISFQCVNMQPGITYNIPKGVWHNIAMKTDAQIIIVENDNTHLKDCKYMDLTQEQHQKVTELIAKAL